MKFRLTWLILIALGGGSGCSTSEPTITIEQLEGEYHAASCPPIIVRGNSLTFVGGRVSFELIRINDENILKTMATPQAVLGEPCKLVIEDEPSYIPVERTDGHFAFEVLSVDRTEAVRFTRNR